MPDETELSADEATRTEALSARTGWLGAGIAAVVLALVLRVLNQASLAGVEPLAQWYVQAAIVVGGVLLYGAAYWLISRGLRRR